MKNILFVVFFNLFSFNLFAQDTFQKIYDVQNGGADTPQDIIELSDGYLIGVGTNCGGISCAGLIRTDLYGNEIWKQQYTKTPYTLKFQDVKIAHNGNFVLCGYEYMSDENHHPYLMEVDAQNGDIIWQQYYEVEFEERDFLSEIILLPNNQYLLQGSGGAVQQYSFLFMLIVDELGNVIYENQIETEHLYSHVADFEVLENKEMVAAYKINEQVTFDDFADLSKLDSLGNIQWTVPLEEVNRNCIPKVEVLNNGNYVVKWCRNNSINPFEVYPFSPLLQCYDPDGALVWEYYYVVDKEYVVNNISVTAEGDILGCGYIQVTEPQQQEHGYVFKMSSTGEMLWEKRIDTAYEPSPGKVMHFLDVQETSDGGIAVVGHLLDTIPNDGFSFYHFNVWFLKLDSNGCMNPDCEGDVLYLSAKEVGGQVELKERFLEASPNPVHTETRVRFLQAVSKENSYLRVYDLQGNERQRIPLEKGISEQSVSFAGYADGAYLLVYERAGRVLQTERLIKY